MKNIKDKAIGIILIAIFIVTPLVIGGWHWYHETYKHREKTNDEVLAELLAEIDRGEWVSAPSTDFKETAPSLDNIKMGVERVILDEIMREYGFRFDVKELKVYHIYDDLYSGLLYTNKVFPHHDCYSFYFRSNGAYYHVTSWFEDFTDGQIDEEF